jgi:hypothetical protein
MKDSRNYQFATSLGFQNFPEKNSQFWQRKRKLWEEINVEKLKLLSEVYRRMNQNITTFNFKSRATELEFLDIKHNCKPINEFEKRQTKTITTI